MTAMKKALQNLFPFFQISLFRLCRPDFLTLNCQELHPYSMHSERKGCVLFPVKRKDLSVSFDLDKHVLTNTKMSGKKAQEELLFLSENAMIFLISPSVVF